MKIAITGGSGFVGLAAAEAIAARGHDVALFDLSAPTAAFRSHPAIAGARFVRADICDGAMLAEAFAAERPEALLHLAALTSNEAMERRGAARIIAVNVGGTATTLEAAAKAGCRRIVALSSIAVYGSRRKDFGTAESLDETTPLCPDTLYGITKRAGEEVAHRLAELHDLELTVLRLGPIFGPWERPGEARPDLSPHAQILAQAAPRLVNEMRADWLYSRDAGAAIAAVVEAAGLGGKTFNLGAGSLSTPREWAAATGIALPEISADAPTVTSRIPPSRPPLAIERLRAAIGAAGTRPITQAAADHMAWLDSVGVKPARATR
ncbi:NAD(P)-dependent oxidoreductase [Aurantimonas sp. 22II-16-19i]|uniref:NAD-dependent epimerase/dehydratase family protein n=1 Tax=Aurantimonas sp. 22II-16-19i TaxID=1317114 RepID=UPI0009F7A419|nr:NAD(P)-dependent oxidoreductase [Aurantimonas sp. 22II-16-19i]ORE95136.1 putative NAD dependent epimerase/dehydratase [Aurantimonas sp. 22II-16-19i]